MKDLQAIQVREQRAVASSSEDAAAIILVSSLALFHCLPVVKGS